jgi:TolB protein
MPMPTLRFHPLSRLATLAALPLLALAVLGACKGGESYTGEPTGLIAFTTTRDYDPDWNERTAGPGSCSDGEDNDGDTMADEDDPRCHNSEIYIMEADGSNPRNFTNNGGTDIEAAWSSDATRIGFSSYRDGPLNLFTAKVDGSDLVKLTDDDAVVGGIRWSPDDSRIAYYNYIQQQNDLLWVMNADGSDPQPLLADLDPTAGPDCAGGFPGSWFPDGERILFRGSKGALSSLQICSIKLDGSPPEIILSEERVLSYYPSLSPDGKKIAFTSNRDSSEDQSRVEVYVMNVDGSGLRRLTKNDSAIDEYPSWSPDGQWLAFHSNRDGDFEIYIMRPDGSDVRQLTDNDRDDTEPAWSPE